MFTVTNSPTFTHPVPVMVPVDGGHEEQTLKATFKVVLVKVQDLSTPEGTLAFLKEILVSLDDICDENAKPIAYSDKVRDQMLALPYVRLALTQTYMAAVTKARVGN